MPAPRSLSPGLLFALGLLLSGCGGSESTSSDGSGGGGASTAAKEKAPEAPPKKEMPKDFPKSGIKEDYARIKEAKDNVKAAKKGEAKQVAEEALATLLNELADKYGAANVHGAECHYLAFIMDEAKRPGEAISAAKRFLEVAEGTESVNIPHMTYIVIKSTAIAGDLDAAEAELEKARTGVFSTKADKVQESATFIAKAAEAKGKLTQAARLWELCMVQGAGDPEAAIFGTDCLQRAGDLAGAVALATKAVAGFESNPKNHERMKDLLAAVQLVGKEAPGFAGAKYWKGVGGPVKTESLKGKLTIVFAWNLQMRTAPQFFSNLNKVQAEYSEQGIEAVGISRIEKYDPIQDGTIKDMTEETELEFYDKWESQFGTRCAFAVAGHEDMTLVEAWAAKRVPALILVGKDGKVAYTRTGYLAEHFDALRSMIERELAK